MKGHRRWLGMVGSGSEIRQIASVDEQAARARARMTYEACARLCARTCPA